MSRAESPSDSETVSIVRYPNRRFYDRSQARYVTLLEIAAMVREGKTIRVRDSKTDEDLTSTILTQIILEHHPERMQLLPVPVLHMMIRTNGVVLGLLREYFRQSVAYLDFWQRASALNPMTKSLEWLHSLVPGSSAPGVIQSSDAGKGRTEAETLAQRLADMERRLNELDPPAQKSAGKGTARPSGRSALRPRRRFGKKEE